mmetsp:Transcript_17332/g.56385  ORF Transcript_17332/g.56385 Transcript_17332/m.56385 type:complete len:227 (-) Transcript_17332:313-993(-)
MGSSVPSPEAPPGQETARKRQETADATVGSRIGITHSHGAARTYAAHGREPQLEDWLVIGTLLVLLELAQLVMSCRHRRRRRGRRRDHRPAHEGRDRAAVLVEEACAPRREDDRLGPQRLVVLLAAHLGVRRRPRRLLRRRLRRRRRSGGVVHWPVAGRKGGVARAVKLRVEDGALAALHVVHVLALDGEPAHHHRRGLEHPPAPPLLPCRRAVGRVTGGGSLRGA